MLTSRSPCRSRTSRANRRTYLGSSRLLACLVSYKINKLSLFSPPALPSVLPSFIPSPLCRPADRLSLALFPRVPVRSSERKTNHRSHDKACTGHTSAYRRLVSKNHARALPIVFSAFSAIAAWRFGENRDSRFSRFRIQQAASVCFCTDRFMALAMKSHKCSIVHLTSPGYSSQLSDSSPHTTESISVAVVVASVSSDSKV